MVVCVDGGGTPDKNWGPKSCFTVLFPDELIPCSFLRSIDPHSGFMYSHSGCVFFLGGGGNPKSLVLL